MESTALIQETATPIQSTFNRNRLRRRSYSASTVTSSFRPLSFLNLTPSPKERRFTQLIDTEELGHQPVYFFPELSPTKCSVSFTPKPKSRFTIPKLTMPSWSISSKSSRASASSAVPPTKAKPQQKRRAYMPQPFFNAVAEYNFLYGGDEEAGIKAVLRERGLNMTVDQAIEVFGNERPGGGGINWAAAGGLLNEEYRSLFDDDDSHSNASSDDTLCSDRYSSYSSDSSSKKSKSKSQRPTHLSISSAPSSYGFEDNYSPSTARMSNASFLTASSGTLYEPSIQSNTSRNSKSGVRGMFGMRR